MKQEHTVKMEVSGTVYIEVWAEEENAQEKARKIVLNDNPDIKEDMLTVVDE